MRYIGVDLHTTQITVCYLTAADEIEIRKFGLCEMDKFVSGLKETDEMAVEATCNTRWFSEQVRESVRRVVLVNPRQFEVVKNSCKKTATNDAINLARFLKADLLPEVRAKRQEAMSRALGDCQRALGTKTGKEIIKTIESSLIFQTNIEIAIGRLILPFKDFFLSN